MFDGKKSLYMIESADIKGDESIVREYLKSLGYKKIVYEPEPNSPPDFLINDDIAIEVRRLNKNLRSDEARFGFYGADNLTFKLSSLIKNVVDSINLEAEVKGSILFNYGFKNPVNMARPLKKKIKAIFQEQLEHLLKNQPYINNDPKSVNNEVYANDNLWFTFFKSHSQLNETFVLISSVNHDLTTWESGQQVLAENIELVIREKEAKIGSKFNQHNYWWLILVDYINYRRDNPQENFSTMIKDNMKFDKLVIIKHPEIQPLGFDALHIDKLQ